MVKAKASKDSRKTHGAAKKGDIFYIDPEKLTLVTDPKSDAYDKRVHDEPEEKFILNIMHYGVQTPIKVRRNAETADTEVIWGRGRTKALRIANKRLIARGDEPHLMPFVVARVAKGLWLRGAIISENEHRREDTPMNKAEKAAAMLDEGGTHEDAGIALGLEVAQVKNLLALLKAPEFVRNAVESEKVTLANGIKAAKLSVKESPEAGRKLIAKLIEEAPRTPGRKRSLNSRKAQEIVGGGPVMQPKKAIIELKARMATKRNEQAALIAATLNWVLGNGADLDVVVAAIDEVVDTSHVALVANAK